VHALPVGPALRVLQAKLYAVALACELGCCSASGVPHLQVSAVTVACELGCCSASGVPHLQVSAVAPACAEQVCYHSEHPWMTEVGFFLFHRPQKRAQSYK
jgi:hypothetical protein